jgi:MFS family permease
MLHDKGGLAGWQWIFLVEGILTILVGGLGAILLVGFPDHWTPSWKFLTEREVRWVIDVVNKDRGDATAEEFSIGKFLRPALDWKIWIYALIFFNTTTISYALAFFLPTIFKYLMGYNDFKSQAMGAPPYIFAGFVMYFCGWAGDRWRVRAPLILMNMALCVAGLSLIGYTDMTPNNTSAINLKLFGVFLVAAGANANIPVVMTWQVSQRRLNCLDLPALNTNTHSNRPTTFEDNGNELFVVLPWLDSVALVALLGHCCSKNRSFQ